MKDNIDVLRYFCVVIYCLCQVNEVNGGDTVFVRCVCVSVCVSVRSGPVNQKGLKRLKLRTSNLTCMFPGTVDNNRPILFTWRRYALPQAPSSFMM